MFGSKIGSLDPCYKGDSGGPLFCSMEDGMMRLSGIYSYGRCGDDETKPSVKDQHTVRCLESYLSNSHDVAGISRQEALKAIFVRKFWLHTVTVKDKTLEVVILRSLHSDWTLLQLDSTSFKLIQI